MQLPSVERAPNLRPAGAEMVAPAAKVIPVAPVNPPAPSAAPVPSVVNEINPAVAAKVAQEGQLTQMPTPDPLKGGADKDNSHRDWTQRKPTPERSMVELKAEVSDILMEHMQSLWSASKRMVEIWLMNNPAQSQNPAQQQQQVQNRNVEPSALPGTLVKENLTYSPSKIKRPENL